jgi:hypothetical protein
MAALFSQTNVTLPPLQRREIVVGWRRPPVHTFAASTHNQIRDVLRTFSI